MISSTEFAELLAYEMVNPQGEERADLRMGIQTAALVNVHVPKGNRAAKPADYIPNFSRRVVRQSGRVMTAIMQSFVELVNASRKR